MIRCRKVPLATLLPLERRRRICLQSKRATLLKEPSKALGQPLLTRWRLCKAKRVELRLLLRRIQSAD